MPTVSAVGANPNTDFRNGVRAFLLLLSSSPVRCIIPPPSSSSFPTGDVSAPATRSPSRRQVSQCSAQDTSEKDVVHGHQWRQKKRLMSRNHVVSSKESDISILRLKRVVFSCKHVLHCSAGGKSLLALRDVFFRDI